MIKIPEGTFMMGACNDTIKTPEQREIIEQNKKRKFMGEPLLPVDDICLNPDPDATTEQMPKHQVEIEEFEIGKTEITLGEYKEYIKDTGQNNILTDEFIEKNHQGDDAPVVMISYNDAIKYIAWLNENFDGTFRLPTEAEWEYACKALNDNKFCGSDIADEVAWYKQDGAAKQRPVARKKPNAFGLYDMSGNVWEWTSDCYHFTYKNAPTDGSSWNENCQSEANMVRGGSWNSGNTHDIKSTTRYSINKNERYDFMGFRVVRD